MRSKNPWTKVAPGLYIAQLHAGRGDLDWFVVQKPPAVKLRRTRRIGPDRDAALEVATHRARELAAAGSSKAKVSDILRRWEDEHFSANLIRSRTQAYYRGHIRNHLVPALGTRRADELRVRDFVAYGAERLGGLRGDALDSRWPTVEGHLRTLRAAVNWYWREYAEDMESPCPGPQVTTAITRLRRRFQPRARSRPHLEPDQVPVLLEAAREVSDLAHDLFAVAFRTGLRRGEILGLRWCEVDWERCWLDDGSGCGPRFQIGVRGQPEVLKSARKAPVRFPPVLLELLRRRRQLRTSDEWIFATREGTPILPRNAARALRLARERAAERGVPLRASELHAARHLFRSLAGVHWSAAQSRAQLGHAGAAMDGRYEHALWGEDSMEWASFDGRVQ